MSNLGRERLDKRHRLHGVIRGAIDRWNYHAQLLHLGRKIDLAAEITEAVMADSDSSCPQEKK